MRLIKWKKLKGKLMNIDEYIELGRYLERNTLNLAGYLLNICCVVFHNNKILGVYSKWD